MPKFEVDFRLLEVRIDASMLPQAHDLVERQIKFLIDQREIQAKADLAALSKAGHDWESADVHLAFQERDYEIEHLFPRLLRGPFLITVWGVYESSVRDVAEFLRRRAKAALTLDEILRRDFLRGAKRYFSAVLSQELIESPASGSELHRLYHLRNALAHAGGRLHTIQSGTARRTVDDLISQGLLVESLGYVAPSQEYAKRATHAVQTELSGLLDRALKRK